MVEKQYLQKLGAQIKKKRMERKLSLLQLAQLLEIEKPNLARIERGGNNITILSLQKIAKALGTSIKDLIDFE